MRIRLLIPLAASCLAALPASSGAQRPSVTAVTATDSLTPLPVLDDFGDMIPESMIQSRMRRGGVRWFMQPFGFIGGGLAAYAAFPRGKTNDNCSIYEPCSDREKFYRGSSFWIGGIIGTLILNAAGAGTSRLQAIEQIRAERRGIHSATERK